jgi:hypothetical protein
VEIAPAAIEVHAAADAPAAVAGRAVVVAGATKHRWTRKRKKGCYWRAALFYVSFLNHFISRASAL